MLKQWYFSKQLINNSNKAVNITIRIHSLDQQEENTNNTQPFDYSALNSLVSSLIKKALFACRLVRLLVHTMYLDAGVACEYHALGRSDTIKYIRLMQT
jgi:hypothetical protein